METTGQGGRATHHGHADTVTPTTTHEGQPDMAVPTTLGRAAPSQTGKASEVHGYTLERRDTEPRPRDTPALPDVAVKTSGRARWPHGSHEIVKEHAVKFTPFPGSCDLFIPLPLAKY